MRSPTGRSSTRSSTRPRARRGSASTTAAVSGIGNSIHSGMVVLADGTADAAERLERVLTGDPGTGVMRHADAGYPEALDGRPRRAGSTCRASARPRVGHADRGSTTSASGDAWRVSRPADPRSGAGRDAGGGSGPLRGAALRDVRVIEDAFVLCRDGRVEAVGPMARAPRAASATSRRSTAAGSSAIPGLVDCHTHACFGGDRVQRVLAARGRRLVRGAPRCGRRHPLDRARDAGGGRGGARPRSRCATGRGCARTARRRSRASRATASTTTRSSPSCARSAPRAGSRRGSARTRCRPSSTTPTRTSTSCSRRSCPRRRQLAEAADVFLERGSFDAAQARRYLEACRDAGLALRLHGDQFTESGAIGLAIELGARSVDHLEATGPAGVAQLAASDVDRRPAPGQRALPRAADAAGTRARRRGRARSPSRRTSTRAAPSATACRSSSRSPARR